MCLLDLLQLECLYSHLCLIVILPYLHIPLELPNATLWCTTEVIKKEEIDAAATILAAAPVEA